MVGSPTGVSVERLTDILKVIDGLICKGLNGCIFTECTVSTESGMMSTGIV